jgi:hypothetical protein
MDVDHDGHVSKAELKRWHLEQGKNSSMRRAANEFETSDNDKDGYVTLKEYLEDDFEQHVDAAEGDDLDHMVGLYKLNVVGALELGFNP